MKPPKIGAGTARKLVSTITGFLGSSEDSRSRRAKETKKPDYWSESVTLTIDSLLQREDGKATDLHILSLGGFRTAIGPELWDDYEGSIRLIADSTIARSVGKGNTYFEQDDDTWFMIMPALSPEKAAERADKITTEIGTKLVGAQFTETEPPLPASARISLEDALNLDGSLNIQAIRQAVAQARDAQDAALPVPPLPPREKKKTPRPQTGPAAADQFDHSIGTKPGSASDPEPPIMQPTIRASMTGSASAREGAPAGRTFHTSGSPTTEAQRPKGRKFATTTSRGVSADSVRAADAPRYSLRPTESDDTETPEDGETLPEAQPTIKQSDADVAAVIFKPAWSLLSEAIDTFCCFPVTKEQSAALYGGDEPQRRANLIETITRLVPIIDGVAKAGLRAKIVLPAPLDVMAGSGRAQVLDALGQIAVPVRLLHLRMEIFGLPEVPNHAPVKKLHDVLSPQLREVAYQLPSPHADADNLKTLTRAVLGIDLHNPSWDGVGFPDAARTLLSLKMENTFLWGVRSRSAVRAAVKAGITEVGGPGLVKPVAKPAQTIPVPKNQFLG